MANYPTSIPPSKRSCKWGFGFKNLIENIGIQVVS